MKLSSTLGYSLMAALLLVSCGGGNLTGNSASSSSASAASSAVAGDIAVTFPAVNATVASPLTVTGEARGTWFFEASFPVKLLDDQGNEIAQGAAQAQGDWMTVNFVPFTVTLTFQTTASNGLLVLEKDNPSGLPENAASYVVPVQF